MYRFWLYFDVTQRRKLVQTLNFSNKITHKVLLKEIKKNVSGLTIVLFCEHLKENFKF